MKFASKIDNYILQESLIEEMNKGLKTKMDEFTNEKQTEIKPQLQELSSQDLNSKILHETIFIPYFTEQISEIHN